MARPNLEIHPEAALELELSYEYYASRSFVAADAFVSEIEAALEGILENPLLWPKYLEGYRRRVLARFPFSISSTAFWMTWSKWWASFPTRSDRGIGERDNLSQAIKAMKTERRATVLL